MKKYNPQEIEPKWQKIWAETELYKTPKNPKSPYYGLVMFAYPSGDLHCGHWYPFVGGDILARHARMQGHDVLHTNGFDAFGLPAENAAIKRGKPADEWTDENVARMLKQYAAMGNMYDTNRMINTSKPEYYKWTQWLFLELYKKGMAYQKEGLVNWCPSCHTTLANEQVIHGQCERCDSKVERKSLKQWYFKITDYTEKLLSGLETIDWPDRIKEAQINWIGKSHGSLVKFPLISPVIPDTNLESNNKPADSLKFTPELTNKIINGTKFSTIRLEAKNLKVGDLVELITRFDKNTTSTFATAKISKLETKNLSDIPIDLKGHENYSSKDEMIKDYRNYYGQDVGESTEFTIYYFEKVIPNAIEVYTTRIDTIYSGTFLVLAPEHPMVEKITTHEQKSAVEKYVSQAGTKTDVDRLEAKEKTGVFSGSYVLNPATNENIPVWIADFVLASYGTGAVFADAHDERDAEFARKYGIALKTSIEPIIGTSQKDPEFRRSIVALIKDPKTNRVLTINWGKHAGGNLLIGGGIDESEDVIEAAKREIAEETGYTDVKFIEKSETIHHYYFTRSKNVARQIDVIGLYFELNSDTQETQKLEADEQGKFKVEWLNLEQAGADIEDGLHSYVFERFINGKIWSGDGILYNSEQFNGLSSAEARNKITEFLQSKGLAQKKVQYRLRDWLISRQRYWGTPIPIVYCEQCGTVALTQKDLPVLLPLGQKIDKNGRSPLTLNKDFYETTCPKCQGSAKRETDTMDTFVDSSWYYLRYPNPHYSNGPFDSKATKQWLPVSSYVGGPEHATMHLLYVRFIGQFLFDQKLLPMSEPLQKFICNGLILGPDGNKMSKSKGNVVDPDEYVSKYGADSVRLYMMFMGPYDEGGPWDPKRFEGAFRFISKVYDLVAINYELKELKTEIEAELERRMHKTIKKVSEDIPRTRFNTAIAALMEFVNFLTKVKTSGNVSEDSWRVSASTLALLLAPITPHLAEEVWQHIGNNESVHIRSWPMFDPNKAKDDVVTIVIQVNGKLRGEFVVEAGVGQAELESLAKAENEKNNFTKDSEIVKTIVVPNRLVNFVIK